MKKILVLVTMALVSVSAFAQKAPKIAYVSVNYVLMNLPDAKVAQEKFITYQKQLDTILMKKYTRADEIIEIVETQGDMLQESVRKDYENELQQLDQQIQQFQQSSQLDLMKKQEELMEPVIKKVNAAIDVVAKEKGYTYVLNADNNTGRIILYGPEEDNLSDAVLVKMGVTPPAKK